MSSQVERIAEATKKAGSNGVTIAQLVKLGVTLSSAYTWISKNVRNGLIRKVGHRNARYVYVGEKPSAEPKKDGEQNLAAIPLAEQIKVLEEERDQLRQQNKRGKFVYTDEEKDKIAEIAAGESFFQSVSISALEITNNAIAQYFTKERQPHRIRKFRSFAEIDHFKKVPVSMLQRIDMFREKYLSEITTNTPERLSIHLADNEEEVETIPNIIQRFVTLENLYNLMEFLVSREAMKRAGMAVGDLKLHELERVLPGVQQQIIDKVKPVIGVTGVSRSQFNTMASMWKSYRADIYIGSMNITCSIR